MAYFTPVAPVAPDLTRQPHVPPVWGHANSTLCSSVPIKMRMSLRRGGSRRISPSCRRRRLIAGYLSIDAKQVTDEAHLTDDLGLDWLDQLELLVLIEDEFAGVEFFATAHVELVGDLIRQVEQRNAAPIRRSAA